MQPGTDSLAVLLSLILNRVFTLAWRPPSESSRKPGLAFWNKDLRSCCFSPFLMGSSAKAATLTMTSSASFCACVVRKYSATPGRAATLVTLQPAIGSGAPLPTTPCWSTVQNRTVSFRGRAGFSFLETKQRSVRYNMGETHAGPSCALHTLDISLLGSC